MIGFPIPDDEAKRDAVSEPLHYFAERIKNISNRIEIADQKRFNRRVILLR